uniref:Methyltranfer_dom domain-containing protein n=1 Tax=Anopheles christyi TaxID=43041 RepID=A0A182K7A5_9DIPT
MFQFTETVPFDYRVYFAAAIRFLEKYSWIFRYNNTKFIRCGVLEALPPEWIADLNTLSNTEFNQIPLGLYKDSWSSSFREFLLQVRNLQVEYEDFVEPEEISRISNNVKKHYEVTNLGSFIASLRCASSDPPPVYVDIGCGVGLLTGLVKELFNVKVLGIDGNEALIKQCNKNVAKTEDLQFIQHFITNDSFTFIERELGDRFHEPNATIRAAVMGLHACADLSITAIDCFLRSSWCRSITIMPCCYHLMKTLQRETSPKGENEFQNFPLSSELHSMVDVGNRTIICKSFLRLACQQTSARWKDLTNEQHLQHGRTMYRRGLIDAILEVDESVRVGKMKKMPEETTVDNMLQQFTLRTVLDGDIQQEQPWTEHHREKLSVLLERYGADGPRLAEYVECLQMCLQKICENVILLDRMCHLEHEAKRLGLQISRKLVRLQNDGITP